jgi:formamidopyrimidine-DNA glycosylase
MSRSSDGGSRMSPSVAGSRIPKVRAVRLLDGISTRELKRRLLGRRVRSTERLAKHLIARLDDGNALFLHFCMTGTIETSAEAAAAPQYEVLHIGLGKGAGRPSLHDASSGTYG